MAPFTDTRKGAKSHRKGAISTEKVPHVAPGTVNRTINRTVRSYARVRARGNHSENSAVETTRKWPRGIDPADPANWDPADLGKDPDTWDSEP